jgi:CheY-like chemotaxis protein
MTAALGAVLPLAAPAAGAPGLKAVKASRPSAILLLDANSRRGELRAAHLRETGAEVRYARSNEDAFFLLQESRYDLVLVEMRNNIAVGQHFCAAVRLDKPGQRIAFYVDGPKCISWLPPDVTAAPAPVQPQMQIKAVVSAAKLAMPEGGRLLEAGWRIRMTKKLAAKSGAMQPDRKTAAWGALLAEQSRA